MKNKFPYLLLFLLGLANISFAQPSEEDELFQNIMDPNVDLEEAIEIMARDFPELLDPVVEAKKDFEKANQVQNSKETGQFYQAQGRKFLKQKNYKQAIIYLEKSIAATKKDLGDIERHPKLSSSYKDLGAAHEGNQEVEKALIIYQEGLRSNASDFDDLDLLSNPEAADIISPLLSIPIFEAKGNLLLQSDRDKSQLLAALLAYERAIEILEFICNKYQIEYSKLQLGNQVMNMTEKGIHTAHKLFKLTRNEQYKIKMFTLADKGKAMALRSALLDGKASGLNSIPPQMLAKESALKVQLANLKQKVKIKTNQNRSAKKLDEKILKASEALYFLQDSLKIFYPEYEYLKSSRPSLAVDSLQDFLRNNNTAIVEYFFGKNKAYVFVITADQLYVDRIRDLDQIQETVLSIRALIKSMSFRTDGRNAYESFVRDASNLYSLVLEKPLGNIETDIDDLVIVPDGPLWLVPFEILLDDQAASGDVNFSADNLPYLLNKYAMTYAHSSRLLFDQQNNYNNTSTSIPFLGYAPGFEGGENVAVRSCFESGADLPELKHSVLELENVSSKFNGQPFFGEGATRASFLKLAPEAEVIHLSTHACMNNDDLLDSRIFFSQNDFISTEDIYNLDINAKTIMLSACQTGLGKVYNGEGMISLARAFQHAGCPSVTMSLWSVVDASTTEMTTIYYDYLMSGYTKSKALQQAKLDFINSQSASKQHPFFWAGFVHLGDFSPLESGGVDGNKMLFFGVGIFILMIVFVLAKKK